MIRFVKHNLYTVGIQFEYNIVVVKALQNLKDSFDVQWNVDYGMWLCPYDKWSNVFHALKERNFVVVVDDNVTDEYLDKYEFKYTEDVFKKTEEALSKKVNAKLYNYQVEDVMRMASGKAFINANDMGLGKTLESICVAEALGGFPCLIVCPVSLKQNWKNEIEKFTRRVSLIMDSRTSSNDLQKMENFYFDYVIVNYEFLRKHAYRFKDKFKIVFYDEAHRLKNPKAQVVKAIQKHINTPKKFFISGTPMMNRPSELWVILNMIRPKIYNDYWMFVKYFCEKRYMRNRVFYDGGKNLNKLHNILSYYMLRHTKNDVLDELPPKQYITQIVPLAREQKKIYEETVDMFAKWYGSQMAKYGEVQTETVFLKMLRLKQVAIMPDLLEGEEGTKIKSGKLERLDEILEELFDKNEKVIVFSQFKKVVENVVKRYQEKHKVVWFHGGTKMEDRQEAVDLFQNDPDTKLFVSTQATAGVGITLTSASYIVHLDKVWNPSITEQANDRIHRIGQKRVSTIITLISKDTIDEYIEKKLKEKEDVFNHIMQGEVTEKAIEKAYDMKDMLNFLTKK